MILILFNAVFRFEILQYFALRRQLSILDDFSRLLRIKLLLMFQNSPFEAKACFHKGFILINVGFIWVPIQETYTSMLLKKSSCWRLEASQSIGSFCKKRTLLIKEVRIK
jgi:hypothetical protein